MPLFSVPARGARSLMLPNAQQRASHEQRAPERDFSESERERDLERGKRIVRAAEKAGDALPARPEKARGAR